jgi:hypothetical protein
MTFSLSYESEKVMAGGKVAFAKRVRFSGKIIKRAERLAEVNLWGGAGFGIIHIKRLVFGEDFFEF